MVREGHLEEEGTFKGSFKNGVALARAKQDGRRKVPIGWEGMKGGKEGYMWVLQASACGLEGSNCKVSRNGQHHLREGK